MPQRGHGKIQFGIKLAVIAGVAAAGQVPASRAASADQQFVSGWTPLPEDVNHLERQLRMPPGHSLGTYSRYYSGIFDGIHRQIHGVLLGTMGHPGVHIVGPTERLPKVFDGGCSVIDVIFDVASNRVVSQECNGLG